MHSKRSIAVDAVLGAAAGLAATWVMGQVTSAIYKREGDEAKEHESRVQGTTAYGVATEKAAHALGTEVNEKQRKRYGSAIHWALGAGAGAVYGVLRPRTAWASWGFGTLYGALFFLFVDEGANTALGLTAPPQEFPWETHARGLAGHTVFGVATEATLRLADDL
ncbi:MAG: hypothetical protein WD273_08425 [Trueperaceae bacterium]